jgi:hypothetical protein
MLPSFHSSVPPFATWLVWNHPSSSSSLNLNLPYFLHPPTSPSPKLSTLSLASLQIYIHRNHEAYNIPCISTHPPHRPSSSSRHLSVPPPICPLTSTSSESYLKQYWQLTSVTKGTKLTSLANELQSATSSTFTRSDVSQAQASLSSLVLSAEESILNQLDITSPNVAEPTTVPAAGAYAVAMGGLVGVVAMI